MIYDHFAAFGRLLLRGKLQFLVAVMSLFCLESYSQSPSKQETVAYINRMLGDKIQVELKGGTLFVTFRDEQQKVVREDKVPTPDLELKISYEKEGDYSVFPASAISLNVSPDAHCTENKKRVWAFKHSCYR